MKSPNAQVLSPEQHPSTVFRDVMRLDFIVKAKDLGAPIVVHPKEVILEGYGFMLLSAKSTTLSRFFMQLGAGKIYLRAAPETPVLAYVDVDYARVKLMKSANVLGRPLIAVRLIKGKTYEEILHEDESTAQRWFEALKRYCVLSKFREQYEVGNSIGKGNFAKVIACRSLVDSQDLACKIFDKKLILQDKFERQCLLYELKMMREVCHPNLLRVLEIFEGDNSIYCVGKLYKGATLHSLILDKHHKFEEREVVTVADKLLRVGFTHQALEYLEAKSIIHRDIKPENVVFAKSGSLDEPVLVDLGFATFEKDYKMLFSRCGTPGHVAPEVLNDRPYSTNADVYSLGIVLYMMLAKANPFEHADYDTLIQNNLNGKVDIASLPASAQGSLSRN